MIFANDRYLKTINKESMLEDRLIKSEVERKILETRFQYLARLSKETEEQRVNNLKEKYSNFVKDCKVRNSRNNDILKSLQKLENGATAVFAKTERLKQLRNHFDAYLSRAVPLWRHPEGLDVSGSFSCSLGTWAKEPPSSNLTRPALLLPGGGAVILPVATNTCGNHSPNVLQYAPNKGKGIASLGEAGLRMMRELSLIEGTDNANLTHLAPVHYQHYHLPIYLPPSCHLDSCTSLDAQSPSKHGIHSTRNPLGSFPTTPAAKLINKKDESLKENVEIECLQADECQYVEDDTENLSEDELDAVKSCSRNSVENSIKTNPEKVIGNVSSAKFYGNNDATLAHRNSIKELKSFLTDNGDGNDHSTSFSREEEFFDEDVPEEFNEQNYTDSRNDPRFQRDVSRNVILEEDEDNEEELNHNVKSEWKSVLASGQKQPSLRKEMLNKINESHQHFPEPRSYLGSYDQSNSERSDEGRMVDGDRQIASSRSLPLYGDPRMRPSQNTFQFPSPVVESFRTAEHLDDQIQQSEEFRRLPQEDINRPQIPSEMPKPSVKGAVLQARRLQVPEPKGEQRREDDYLDGDDRQHQYVGDERLNQYHAYAVNERQPHWDPPAHQFPENRQRSPQNSQMDYVQSGVKVPQPFEDLQAKPETLIESGGELHNYSNEIYSYDADNDNQFAGVSDSSHVETALETQLHDSHVDHGNWQQSQNELYPESYEELPPNQHWQYDYEPRSIHDTNNAPGYPLNNELIMEESNSHYVGWQQGEPQKYNFPTGSANQMYYEPQVEMNRNLHEDMDADNPVSFYDEVRHSTNEDRLDSYQYGPHPNNSTSEQQNYENSSHLLGQQDGDSHGSPQQYDNTGIQQQYDDNIRENHLQQFDSSSPVTAHYYASNVNEEPNPNLTQQYERSNANGVMNVNSAPTNTSLVDHLAAAHQEQTTPGAVHDYKSPSREGQYSSNSPSRPISAESNLKYELTYESNPPTGQTKREHDKGSPPTVKSSVVNQLLDSESESYQLEPAGSQPEDSDFDFSIGKQ